MFIGIHHRLPRLSHGLVYFVHGLCRVRDVSEETEYSKRGLVSATMTSLRSFKSCTRSKSCSCCLIASLKTKIHINKSISQPCAIQRKSQKIQSTQLVQFLVQRLYGAVQLGDDVVFDVFVGEAARKIIRCDVLGRLPIDTPWIHSFLMQNLYHPKMKRPSYSSTAASFVNPTPSYLSLLSFSSFPSDDVINNMTSSHDDVTWDFLFVLVPCPRPCECLCWRSRV